LLAGGPGKRSVRWRQRRQASPLTVRDLLGQPPATRPFCARALSML